MQIHLIIPVEIYTILLLYKSLIIIIIIQVVDKLKEKIKKNSIPEERK